MPEAAVADVTAGFDLSSEIGAALDAPAPVSDPSPSPDLTPATEPAAPATPETPAAEPAAPAEPVKAADPEVIPEPEALIVPPAKIEGDLPEGIAVRDLKDGRKEYVLDESHAGSILNAYHAAQAAEEILGTPLTKDVAQELYNDHIVRSRVESDLIAGGKEGAGRILGYFNNLARQAITNGETGADGMANLAAQMPLFFAQNNPAAYEAQYSTYLRHGLDSLYQKARDSDDANLRNAVAWVDNKIFGSHRKADATPKSDPLATREARVREAETRMQQTSQQAARQQWTSEVNATYENINEKVDRVVNEFTKALEAPYKAYPKQLTSVRDQLRKILNTSVSKDANWNQQRNDLLARAQSASPGPIRKELLETVANLTEQKARHSLNPARNAEVLAIINEAAALVKAQNDAAIARAQKGADRRQPGPGGAAPDRSALPATAQDTGKLSRDEIVADMMQVLG